MNRVWPVLLKSIVMLVLFVAMVALTVLTAFSLIMRSHYPLLFLLITGIFYVGFNIVCFIHLCDSTNKLLLILLLLTQTVLIYPLCLKIWRAFTAAIEKDQAIRKQKILKATYANWASMKPSVKHLPDIDMPHMFGSCVPSRPAPLSSTEATGQQDASLPDEISPALEVTNTRFQSNTRTIRLSLDTPNIYGGEPNVCKYVTRTLKHLLIKKKLSYHIITNSSQDILHVSKSKAIPAQLPDRVVQEDPLVICNDNHYIISFVKCLWFENFEVTKRSDSKIENYEQVDLNKFIWPMVWPATVILFYAMFDLERFSQRSIFPLICPAVGVVVWLLSRNNVDEIWKNILLLMPLRIFFTVSRTLLVCAIAVPWFLPAFSIYVTAKIIGVIVLSIHLTYAKVMRNVELFGDPIDKYTFNPLLQFWMQLAESCVYFIWGFAWRFSENNPSPVQRGVLAMAIICNIAGLIWQRVVKSYHVELLRDPVKVFQITQNRMGKTLQNGPGA